MVELITQVDENDNVVGLKSREEILEKGLVYRSSHLLLFNSERQVFLQKRGSDKRLYPRLYTFSVNGTVGNETYEECIKREMQEEIGISVPFKSLFKFRHFYKNNNTFKAVFIAKSNLKLKIDKREVESFLWIHLEELKKDVKKNPKKYTPPFVKGINILFEHYLDKINSFLDHE